MLSVPALVPAPWVGAVYVNSSVKLDNPGPFKATIFEGYESPDLYVTGLGISCLSVLRAGSEPRGRERIKDGFILFEQFNMLMHAGGHRRAMSFRLQCSDLEELDRLLEMLTNLGEINGHGPSSFPRYVLDVDINTMPAAEFSTNVFTFQQTLDGRVAGSWNNTFLPLDCIIYAYLKSEDDFEEEISLRAILHNSAPEPATIARIGRHLDGDEDWTASTLYLNGKAASHLEEEEIVEKYKWLGRSYLHSEGYPPFGFEEAIAM